MNPLLIYLYTLLLFIALDAAWFYFYSYKKIYQPQFELINKNSKFKIRKIPAAITYLVLATGLFLFLFYCRAKSSKKLKSLKFLALGAIFGFVVYGTYNGTNYATLEKYSLKTAITDTIWGTIVCGVISYIISFSLK